MPIPFLAQLAIVLILNVVSAVLAPRPKPPKPSEVKDMDAPTAEAGRPVPVVFGTETIRGINTIWYGEKATEIEDA